MTTDTWAIYEGGKLRPLQSLPLSEGETVRLTVTQEQPPLPSTQKEAERWLRCAKTLQELFASYESALNGNEDYELAQSLDANRQGERPLFPPDRKGVSW